MNMSERRSSSSSPRVSPSMIVPKREPLENDMILNSKRRCGEHLSHETDIIQPNKRQMATKKHQQPQTKIRNGTNDEQQIHKRIDSTSFINGGSNESVSSSSTTSNIQGKPR